MKVLFACGGTAGHINPALAVATELRRRVPDCDILFVGNPNGMEATGFRFAPYRSMGIQRRLTWENVKRNAKSVCLLLTARSRAEKLLRDYAPDVVMGTGSYISAPILLAAAALRIPCMTHEANALPGVSNRMVAQKVDKFLLAVPEAEKHLPQRQDYIATPFVRRSLRPTGPPPAPVWGSAPGSCVCCPLAAAWGRRPSMKP